MELIERINKLKKQKQNKTKEKTEAHDADTPDVEQWFVFQTKNTTEYFFGYVITHWGCTTIYQSAALIYQFIWIKVYKTLDRSPSMSIMSGAYVFIKTPLTAVELWLRSILHNFYSWYFCG